MSSSKNDHYVAQTYLKNFSVKGHFGLVNAVQKNNLRVHSKIPVGSLFSKKHWSRIDLWKGNERVVEDYLRHYEPSWNSCVSALISMQFDERTKFLMSGYIAYLAACAPTAARLAHISTEEFLQLLYDTVERSELRKLSPEARKEVEAAKRKSDLRNITVVDDIPKAMGITGLSKYRDSFYSFRWIILQNETSVPFITSDNPVCRDYRNGSGCAIYCPISPKYAILIDADKERSERDYDEHRLISLEGVHYINELVVKSAEKMVIFSDSPDSVLETVKRFQDWHVGLQIFKIPQPRGEILITRIKAMNEKDYASSHSRLKTIDRK